MIDCLLMQEEVHSICSGCALQSCVCDNGALNSNEKTASQEICSDNTYIGNFASNIVTDFIANSDPKHDNVCY